MKLYLIPNSLGESNINSIIPYDVQNIIKSTGYFIVENVRNARRYLKKIDQSIDINKRTFFELNKRTTARDFENYLEPIHSNNIGLITEAGCPAIADPGATIIALAHQKKIEVVPLVGPSSIILSLMASGLNGQNFAFCGYLPIYQGERIKKIKQLENLSKKEGQTQIFIETPYRNTQLLKDILAHCNAYTLLCIASLITTNHEYVKTKTIHYWRQEKNIDIHKKPTIYLMQSP